jgi:hypothetical protein
LKLNLRRQWLQSFTPTPKRQILLAETMPCNICGSEINQNQEFCENCGTVTTAEDLLSIAMLDAIKMKDINFPKSDKLNQDFIHNEIKKAGYKLSNEDLVGAEAIYENIAVSYNVPAAWLYLGRLKLLQLENGTGTVKQALNCFTKASEKLPGAKPVYQVMYSSLSRQLIARFLNLYLETIAETKKAKSGRFWNVALVGLSVGLGNQRSKTGNNAFRGAAGVAGAAYGLNKINQHSQNLAASEDVKNFLENTISQLIAGVEVFCSDYEPAYKDFSEYIERIANSNKSLKIFREIGGE